MRGLVAILCLIQVLVISYLTVNILNKKAVLGDKSSFGIPDPKANLKYFYELDPNGNGQAYKSEWSDADYVINRDTLRADKEFLVNEKTKVRIIALGDSFTYGINVKAKDTWPDKLEEMLSVNGCQNVEIINLGVPGYDAQYSVERFRKRGIKYDPDLIIWVHTDLKRVNEALIPAQQEYLWENKEKETRQFWAESWLRAKQDTIDQFGGENILTFQKQVIESLRQYYGEDLLIAYLPYKLDLLETQVLQEISNENQKTFLLRLSNLQENNDLLNVKDSYPNEKGHKVIAGDLLNYLQGMKLLSCLM
jgi:hypothetical protein